MGKKKVENVSLPSPQQNKIENINSLSDTKADFEKAISESSFGVFNLILTLITIPSVLTSLFETGSLAYIYPAAQCDLNLSFQDRGLINAVTYIGMIISCFIWGSLTDVVGRRKILIISHFLGCIPSLMAAFAPNVSVLIIAKFFGGFLINGVCMAMPAYLSEFHGAKYRSRVPLIIGLLYNAGNICLPLLAWAILHLNINFNFFSDFEFHAWNLYLFISTLSSLFSGICYMLLPESPKYLMSKGNNEQALIVFQKIFRLNTRQAENQYTIKVLADEKQIISNKKHPIKDAFRQISPLFSRQYLTKLILVCSQEFLLMMCVNSLRLWLPEMFQIVNDYEFDVNSESTSFCKIINTMQSTNGNDAEDCSMNFDNSSVYINSIIVASSAVVAYAAAALCVNKIGKKRILIILGLFSGASVACVYFAPNTAAAVVLICIHLASACICVDVVITIIVDVFPTSVRTSALSLALMSGRIGSVFGNLIYPLLLQAGCAAQFFTLASAIIGTTSLSLFLPKTDFTALK